MSFLPADLLVDILSRLPVKSLMRFRCISNFWNTLVNDPDFIKLHLNQSIINGTNNHNHLVFKPDSKLFQLQYPFDFESPNVPKQIDIDQYSLPLASELVATCNGLLCLSTHHNSIIILNPSTRKYKVSVEEPVQYLGHAVSRHPIFGFGYDSVTDEYKIVRIVYFQFLLFIDVNSLLQSEVHVYQVRTNSWNKVSSIPFDIRDRSRSSSGVLVNGALHWMGARVDTRTASSDISHDLIVSFGIRDEEFREVPQPDDDFGDVMDKKILMIKNGCLCMIRFTSRNRDFGYEVWVMKDYGVKESWTKEYVIEETKLIGVATKYFKPIVFLKNGEQILIEGTNGKLIVYDLKKEQIKDFFTIVGVTDWIEKMTYVESLVPLESLDLKWSKLWKIDGVSPRIESLVPLESLDLKWSKLWKIDGVSPRIILFIWRALHNELPVGSVLRKMYGGDGLCSYCHCQVETVEHCLFHCHKAAALWLAAGINTPQSQFVCSLPQVISNWMKEDIDYIRRSCAILWTLWKARNDWVFSAIDKSTIELLQAADTLFHDYKLPPDPNSPTILLATPTNLSHHWQLPPQSFVKINFDGSCMNRKIAAAALARDERGAFLGCMTKSNGLGFPIQAEAQGCLLAIDLIHRLHLSNVQVEGDSKILIDNINASSDCVDWKIAPTVRACKRLISARNDISFHFSPKSTNNVADSLANHAITYRVNQFWGGGLPPPFLLDPLIYDLVSAVTPSVDE